MNGVGDVSELMLRCDGLGLDIVSADANCAGGWSEDTCNRSQGSGLAGAVGANQSDNFARLDREAEITDCDEIGIAFGELLDMNNGNGLVHWNAVIGHYDCSEANCQGVDLRS